MMRYVWRIGLLATISREDVVAFITPVIRRRAHAPGPSTVDAEPVGDG